MKRVRPSAVSRRFVLRAGASATLALPFLEGLFPRHAHAFAGDACRQSGFLPQRSLAAEQSFAIFFRQAAGVACAQKTPIGEEPERFWPRNPGALTPESLEGRALEELLDHRENLLVLGGVNMRYYDFGDGHATGALQGLTARGPVVKGAAGKSEASGESIDHRIGRELNPAGRDSLFLYAGLNAGWLGGACISYREANVKRAPVNSPLDAYAQMMGLDPNTQADIIERQSSINDLVREQLQQIRRHSALSSSDVRRIDLHLQSVRDLEVGLSCQFKADQLAELEGLAKGFESTDGREVLQAARAHLRIAALAVACGYTRSVAIQVGNGNDGITRYGDPDTGELMPDNYHFVTHRRQSHGSTGDLIEGADLLHHKVDRQFAQCFRELLDQMQLYRLPDDRPLLDAGFCAWYNDNANGPMHGVRNVPWIIAGKANESLRQGEYLEIARDKSIPDDAQHRRLLISLAHAVGVSGPDGGVIDDFGDPETAGGRLDVIFK